MIEVLERSSGNVIGIRCNGKLMHEDYQQFAAKLEAILQQYGAIRCYCEMAGFSGIELRALWDETKFDLKHARQLERCAIVGDKSWHRWMTKASQMIFGKANVRYFPEGESEDAWEWVEAENRYCCSTADTTAERD
jgi:hypothetical protein